MLFQSNRITLAVAAALVALIPNSVTAKSGACSYHPFILGGLSSPETYANIPTSCGTMYGHLDIGYVMSIENGSGQGCNVCYAVKSQLTGKEVYILGVDQKGSAGLDIGESAWADLGHNERVDTNDPHHFAQMQTCDWREVDASNCAGICKSQVPGLDCTQNCQQSVAYTVYTTAIQIDKDKAVTQCKASGPVLPDSTGLVDFKGVQVNQGYIDSMNRGSFLA